MKKNILVVGSGGREHALVWKIAQSPLVNKIYCAPGNAGIARHAKCLPVLIEDLDGLVALAKEKDIGLAVVGPEAPLAMGLVDRFKAAGIPAFGPSAQAARLEGSKAFMKEILAKYNIPTASFQTFTDAAQAKTYIRAQGAPIVIKASGLAAGKGVVVCQTVEQALDTVDEIMVRRIFGDAGNQVVVEEFLEGEEVSLLALVDGKHILPLEGAQDHKTIGEGDTGPNTGGMGAYSPAPVLTEALRQRAVEEILMPTVAAMAQEGSPYRGVLYAGLMIQGDRIRVLEYNVRFGDPETQPILMRMKSDIVPLLLAAATGSLQAARIEWDPRPALGVVMASQGYPGPYEKAFPISGLDEADQIADLMVFHACTRTRGTELITCGGRVLCVTALGDTVTEAAARCYQGVQQITWKNAYFRRDIGYRAMAREKQS